MTVTRDRLSPELAELVDDTLSAFALQELPAMLFGSRARNDHNAGSDVDLLIVGGEEYRRRLLGSVTLTIYPRDLLMSMAEDGSLFTLHLIHEGIVVRDPDEVFARLQVRQHPIDVRRRRAELIAGLNILRSIDVSGEESHEKLVDGVRLGIFLMRTELYLRTVEADDICFSIQRLAELFECPRIWSLYTLKYQRELKIADFYDIRGFLTEELFAHHIRDRSTLADVKCQARGPSFLHSFSNFVY